MSGFSTFTYSKQYYVSEEIDFVTDPDPEFGITYRLPDNFINLLADNLVVYDKVGIGTSTPTSTSELYVVGDALITGATNSLVYTTSGTLSETNGSAATFTINASTTQLYCHNASFNGSKTFQISNLTNGKSVYLYLKNTNASSRIISIQASTSSSGYSSVELSRSGSSSVNSFTISATNGTAAVWVTNIDGNLVGSLS